MEREDNRERVLKWSIGVEGEYPIDKKSELSNALYAFSELGLFEDLSIDPPLALMVWAVVEKVRREGFPDELRM